MTLRRKHDLVLAAYPYTRGFAFVLFEGPLAPVDWGVRDARGINRNERCLRSLVTILYHYQPDALVIQDTSERGTRRAGRIRRLNHVITQVAEVNSIPIFAFSRSQVTRCFAAHGVSTKHGIAETIAKHIPALDRYVPPKRKPWKAEDARMGLFDAAALALTFFQSEDADNHLATDLA